MTPTERQLIVDAIDFVQAERDELFRSQEVDGVIEDADIAMEIGRYDSWLKRARESVA